MLRDASEEADTQVSVSLSVQHRNRGGACAGPTGLCAAGCPSRGLFLSSGAQAASGQDGSSDLCGWDAWAHSCPGPGILREPLWGQCLQTLCSSCPSGQRPLPTPPPGLFNYSPAGRGPRSRGLDSSLVTLQPLTPGSPSSLLDPHPVVLRRPRQDCLGQGGLLTPWPRLSLLPPVS